MLERAIFYLFYGSQLDKPPILSLDELVRHQAQPGEEMTEIIRTLFRISQHFNKDDIQRIQHLSCAKGGPCRKVHFQSRYFSNLQLSIMMTSPFVCVQIIYLSDKNFA